VVRPVTHYIAQQARTIIQSAVAGDGEAAAEAAADIYNTGFSAGAGWGERKRYEEIVAWLDDYDPEMSEALQRRFAG